MSLESAQHVHKKKTHMKKKKKKIGDSRRITGFKQPLVKF